MMEIGQDELRPEAKCVPVFPDPGILIVINCFAIIPYFPFVFLDGVIRLVMINTLLSTDK